MSPSRNNTTSNALCYISENTPETAHRCLQALQAVAAPAAVTKAVLCQQQQARAEERWKAVMVQVQAQARHPTASGPVVWPSSCHLAVAT